MTAQAILQPCSDTKTEPFDIGFGEMYPDPEIMATGRVPAEVYFSEEQFEIEKLIFKSMWIFAGRVEQIREPGEWFVKELEICDTSVIVVRDKDMSVRAFHNVCTHRGMRLLWTETGKSNGFTCPYHAWSFGTDGGCRGISDPASFPGLCKEDMGLKAVSVGVWQGFIFINVDRNPRISLEQYLGPIAQRLEGAPWEEYPYAATVTATLDANWKLGSDASAEAYHVCALHAKSCKPWVAPSYNPFVHFLGWEPIGPHRMTSIPVNREYTAQDDHLVQKFAWTRAANNVATLDGERPEGGFASHPDVNPLKADDWCNDAYYLFPTTAIYAAGNGWFIQQYLPLAINRTWYSTSWYYRSPKTCSEQFGLHYSNASSRDITTEDLFAVKGQHDGLASGALDYIYFGEGEIIDRHVAAVMKTAVDAYRRNVLPKGGDVRRLSSVPGSRGQ